MVRSNSLCVNTKCRIIYCCTQAWYLLGFHASLVLHVSPGVRKMLAMAEKPQKKASKTGRPRVHKTPRVFIQARVTAELRQALQELADANRRTRGAELILAIENHLKASGRLPSPPPV